MSTASTRALDRAAAALEGASDYRLAKVLGVAQGAISNYRCGIRQLDDGTALRVAEIAGIPPAQLLAEIAAERSKDDKARKVWTKLARMAATAALCVAMVNGGSWWVRTTDQLVKSGRVRRHRRRRYRPLPLRTSPAAYRTAP